MHVQGLLFDSVNLNTIDCLFLFAARSCEVISPYLPVAHVSHLTVCICKEILGRVPSLLLALQRKATKLDPSKPFH